MNTQEQIKRAESEIYWIQEHRSNGDPFQQKRAVESLLNLIKTLAYRIDELEQKLKN